MRCLCVSVTFMGCVKTNKRIFKKFSQSRSQAILVFPYQTAWKYSDGTPPSGASNGGGVGQNLFSQRISVFAISNCCAVVCISHLAALSSFTASIGRPSATRYKQSPSSVTTETRSIARPLYDSRATWCTNWCISDVKCRLP